MQPAAMIVHIVHIEVIIVHIEIIIHHHDRPWFVLRCAVRAAANLGPH
jgi:hypothetical protein